MTENGDVSAKVTEAAQAYTKQASHLRTLRETKSCDASEIRTAEITLRELKRELDSICKANGINTKRSGSSKTFDREGVESLARKRFFWNPSFDIYGGIKGLYDYGPPGCSIKTNLIQMWRQHFVIQENMLEIEGTCLTMANVLKASGHVDKFADLMVKDLETGDCHRADHVLKDYLGKVLEGEVEEGKKVTEEDRKVAEALRERVDELSAKEIDAEFEKWGIKAPETGNTLSKAYPFNLMFGTQIGPTGLVQGYLRPETAQGIFVNFKKLLDYQGGKLPFACAQIGLAFRNEIAPQNGLLRVREFQQGEIEHFVHPDHKDHPKFKLVKDLRVALYGREQQVTTFQPIHMTLGEAVEKKIIDNETLAYFIGRTHMFVEQVGMNMNHVRFRQHLEHEMAHYASDCWDLEIESSYGWTECAGLADRSCFDLKNHSEFSNQELCAREVFEEKKVVEEVTVLPKKGVVGKKFRKDAQFIMKELEKCEEEQVLKMQKDLEEKGEIEMKVEGKEFVLSKDMVDFKKEKRSITGRNYYPSVIEPSFGIGRLLLSLFEHCYYVREEENYTAEKNDNTPERAVLALPPSIAPIKCMVLPISKNEKFSDMLSKIGQKLGEAGLIYRIDDSGTSIGRRYSRADETGTPFGITVDFDSVKDGSVTLRERDSCKQVRCSAEECVEAVRMMVMGKTKWEKVQGQYPLFDASANA